MSHTIPDLLGFNVPSVNVPKCPAGKCPIEGHPRAFKVGLSHGERRMGLLLRPPGRASKGDGVEGLTPERPLTEVGSIPTAPIPQDPKWKDKRAQPLCISF